MTESKEGIRLFTYIRLLFFSFDSLVELSPPSTSIPCNSATLSEYSLVVKFPEFPLSRKSLPHLSALSREQENVAEREYLNRCDEFSTFLDS